MRTIGPVGADEQTSDELSTHYGEGGPVAVAREWIADVVHEGNLAATWRLKEEQLRLRLARAWIETSGDEVQGAARDPDELARALAAEAPDDPLWRDFAAALLAHLREERQDFSLDHVGAAEPPQSHCS